MKVTSVEIHSKPELLVDETPSSTPEIGIQHWYLSPNSSDQIGGPTSETYIDAAEHLSGAIYVSAEGENFIVGQGWAHYPVPPSVIYETDLWNAFESFFDLDTSLLTEAPISISLRLHPASTNLSDPPQSYILAIYDWGGGDISESDWRTPAVLAGLTPIGSVDYDGSLDTIDIPIDPSALVLGGHTRIILFTDDLRDEISPGGPDGATGILVTNLRTTLFDVSSAPTEIFIPELVPTPSDDSIILSFRDPTAENPYNARSIEGLDVDLIVPNFAGATDISQFYNLLMKKRTVVVDAGLNPNLEEFETFSDLRDDIYRLIASTRTGDIQLQFKNDDDVVAAINGKIAKFETDHFSKDQDVKLTIECRDPMLRSLQRGSVDITHLDPNATTIQDDDSTAPHGFIFVMGFRSSVPMLTIANATFGSAFTVRGDFVAGDELYFSSEFNNKYLYRLRGSAITHLADKIDLNGIWPILFPGETEMQINVGTAAFWKEISHFKTYWGL